MLTLSLRRILRSPPPLSGRVLAGARPGYDWRDHRPCRRDLWRACRRQVDRQPLRVPPRALVQDKGPEHGGRLARADAGGSWEELIHVQVGVQATRSHALRATRRDVDARTLSRGKLLAGRGRLAAQQLAVHELLEERPRRSAYINRRQIRFR